jgi:hypothetical protein
LVTNFVYQTPSIADANLKCDAWLIGTYSNQLML